MTFKVTHINARRQRRQLVVEAGGRKAAEAKVLLQLGSALYLSVIKVTGRAA